MYGYYARLIERMAKSPRWFAAIFFVISLGFFWGASQVRLDGDLARLLPDSSRTVQGLRQLEASYGDQIGRLTVVLQSSDAAKSRAAADAVAEALEGGEGVDRVELKDPRTELRDLRLLYVSTTDLETLDERLSKRIRWEKQRANPLFVDVGNRPRPEVDVSDIEKNYAGKIGERTYYEGPSGEVLVFVRPNFPAADLDQDRKLVSGVDATVRQVLASHPGVSHALTGRYVKRIEQQDILTSDIARATPVVLGLLALFLLVYFRSFGAAVLVVIPLVVGTAAGMSFAVGVFGNLNILTGFLGAILMGLGVDYGIHLISRYLDVRRSTGRGPAESWVQGFATAGRASIYAGLTTMIALGSLAVSTFRAFYEFGVIAMGGITLILLSYALLLPVLLFLIPERFLRPSLASVVGGFLDRRLRGFAPEERGMHLKVMVVAGSVVVLSALGMGLAGGPSLAFDRTFASLAMTEGEAWRLDEMVNDVLGESQTPAVVMVEDATHRAAVIAELKRRQGLEGGVAIGGVLSIDDVVPTDQARKLEILEGLKSRIDGVPAAARSQELVDFMEEIERTVAHGPITRDNLPRSLSKPFSRTDSADAGIVLVLPGVDLNTAEGSELFTRMVRGLPGAHGGEVDAIADSMLLVDIMGFVVADTEWMVGLTFVGVLGVALFAFGWRRETLLVVVFLTVSIVSALGTVALMGQTYNFINVLVFPIWLGLGVDASFHLLIHLRAHPEKFGDLVSTTVSVMAAFLTSIIGFAALTLSHHQGLNSLGWVASIGLVMILAVNAAIAGVLGATAQRRLL